MKNKRGIFFSVDAIIAASILLIAVLLAISTYKSVRPALAVNHISGDIITSLAEIKIYEVSNDSYVSQLISEGYITKLNNTVLEQIGELWAERDLEQAKNLSFEFMKYLPANFGYGVYINGETIAENPAVPVNSLSSAHKIISGIQKNRSSDGYVAKAFATKAKKNNTLIVKGDVITSSVRKSPSGNNGNKVNVTYSFYIPANSALLGSYWFIEAAWTDTKFKAYLNGRFIPGSDASGSKLLDDLNDYLVIGNNTAGVEYRYGSGGYEGGDDGATHLVVNYSTSQINTLGDTSKFYFGEVKSNASIRYKKPIFVAGAINSMNINLNVIARNATLKYILDGVAYNVSFKNVANNNVQWSDSEIKDALNINDHNYENLSNKYFWLQIDLDKYNSIENFGIQRSILPDSYVMVDSDSTLGAFGHLDVTSVVDVYKFNTTQQGNFYRNVEWRFNVTSGTIPVSLDSQLAWLYQSETNPSQTVKSNAKVLYSHPPSPLIVEFARFGYTQKDMINGTNAYTVNLGSGYGINPDYSLASKTILIPVSVGYGDTFQSLSSATDDAANRLNALLGDLVSATEIGTDVITLSKVPSMWGPAVVEVRVWQ